MESCGEQALAVGTRMAHAVAELMPAEAEGAEGLEPSDVRIGFLEGKPRVIPKYGF